MYLCRDRREGSVAHGILTAYRNRQWKEGSGKCEGGEAAVNFQNEAGWREVGKTENEREKAADFQHAGDSAYRNNSLHPIHLYQPT